jgi:predicted transcriptional regulator
MSKDVKINKLVTEKETSRKIVKEILDFGVTENQKLDIMYFICLSLESNKKLKEISEMLNKHRVSLSEENTEDAEISNKQQNKLLLS